MNITEIKDYILIISGLGTFLSALIAMITVIEIKKQRRSSYIPDIILDTYTAYWYWNLKLTEDSMFEYKRSTYNVWTKDKISEEKQIFILYKLQNIGLGVAKYVECKWQFDYKKAIAEIKNVMPPEYSLTISENNIMLKRHDEEYLDFLYYSDLDTDLVDFILPETQNTNNKDSTIPNLAISLHLYYLIFKNDVLNKDENEKFEYEEFENFPNLKMTMMYRDVRNKNYKKKFELKFQIANTSRHSQNDDNELGIFYINVREK